MGNLDDQWKQIIHQTRRHVMRKFCRGQPMECDSMDKVKWFMIINEFWKAGLLCVANDTEAATSIQHDLDSTESENQAGISHENMAQQAVLQIFIFDTKNQWLQCSGSRIHDEE